MSSDLAALQQFLRSLKFYFIYFWLVVGGRGNGGLGLSGIRWGPGRSVGGISEWDQKWAPHALTHAQTHSYLHLHLMG